MQVESRSVSTRPDWLTDRAAVGVSAVGPGGRVGWQRLSALERTGHDDALGAVVKVIQGWEGQS